MELPADLRLRRSGPTWPWHPVYQEPQPGRPVESCCIGPGFRTPVISMGHGHHLVVAWSLLSTVPTFLKKYSGLDDFVTIVSQ